MIEKMTPEQEAQMAVYRDQWISIGLNTDRVDQEKAKEAVFKMYECAGLERPGTVLFADGPIDGAAKLSDYAGKTITMQEMCDAVVYGSQEAFWLSFYDFMDKIMEVKNLDSVFGLIEVAKTCGWVACYDEVACIMDRPLHIKMDEQKRLHGETGPAIEYADGFTVHSWHGTRVPERFIKKEITAVEALKEENLELRRCACEILGWAAILRELDPTVIDKDPDPQIGELLEVDIPDIGTEKYLRVLCGTGREFALPVPPDMKRARQANAWTYGLDESEYNPEIRT